MRESLVTRRIQQVPQAGDRLGELRVAVFDQVARDLLTFPPAHMWQNGQHLECKTAFNVRKVDNCILEVVQH